MARRISVEIIGDASSLEKAFRQSERSTRGFANTMGKIGKTAALAAGTAGVGALVLALKEGIGEFSDSQKAMAQTNAVLKSTGGVAGTTAKHVTALATALSNMSGIDDEVIQGGENMLLTFTNLRDVAGKGNDVFTQATKVLLDLSVATGNDMTKSAIQLGKALNDPVKGMGALQRVGVTFDAQQKKTITTLVQTGHTMEAQKIILAELRKEFGGSAEAYGRTLPGALNRLRNAFDNIAGSLVGLVAPAFERLTDRVAKWLQDSQNQKRVLDDAQKAFYAVRDAVVGMAGAVQQMIGPARTLYGIFGQWRGILAILIGLKVRGWLLGIGGGFTGLGNNANTAAGQVAGVSRKLRALNGLRVVATIAIASELVNQVTGKNVTGRSKLYDLAHDINPTTGKQGIFGQAIGAIVKGVTLGHSRFGSGTGRVTTGKSFFDPGTALSGVIGAGRTQQARSLQAAGEAAKRRRIPTPAYSGTATAPTGGGLDTTAKKARTAAGAAAGAKPGPADLPGVLQYALAVAQGTKAVSDDVHAITRVLAFLGGKLEKTKGLKARSEIVQAINQYRGEQKDLTEQLRQTARDRSEARAAARNARQFRALGLTRTGEERAPGVRALRHELGRLETGITGTILDTKKTHSVLARVRRVLAGGLGAVGRDVKLKVKEILDGFDQTLKDHATSRRTFRQVNVDKILAGLGLSPAQERAARLRLSQIGPGGTLPRRATGGFGFATPYGAQGFFVNTVHVHGVQDPDQFTRALQRKRGSWAGQRRGRFSGNRLGLG